MYQRQVTYLNTPLAASRSQRTSYKLGDNTGSLTSTSGRCYAQLIGSYTRAVSAFDAWYYVHGVAAATTGYAEIALGTSTTADLFTATVSITPVAYASIDTQVKIATTVAYRNAFTGLSIGPGVDIWVMVVASYDTTQASFRSSAGGNGDIRGYARYLAAFRPSTNIGTPGSFGLAGAVGAATSIPWMDGTPV